MEEDGGRWCETRRQSEGDGGRGSDVAEILLLVLKVKLTSNRLEIKLKTTNIIYFFLKDTWVILSS